MKKTLTVLMMVLLAAMLIVSCDNKTNEPKSETPSETPTTPSEPTPSNPTTPTKTTYTVTFDVNGGTGTFADKTTGTDGKVSKPETDPKKTNAVFLYWSKDKSTEFDFDTALTERTTLYAVWKTEFSVGDIGPAGGYIFYDCDADNNIEKEDKDGARKYNLDGLTSSECGWRYLEAAPSDLTVTDSGEVMTTFSFGLYDPDGGTNWVEIGTSTDVGKGQENTTAIISKITSNVAASRCSSWTYKDYGDWFLPSLNELVLMYNNLKAKNTGGTWADEEYLSSTEKDMLNAYGVFFSNGNQENYNRDRPYRVRPVRAFK